MKTGLADLEEKRQQWHLMEPGEVLQAFLTSEEGLNSAEVKRRQERYGMNEITEEKRISILKIFLSQFKNALILILLVATAISAAIGNVIDATVIFAAVFLCVILGFFFEYRSEKAIKALKEIAAPTASVIREGNEVKIPSKEIVPGDILVLRAGDRVAADARLFEEVNLKMDESPLTGESRAVKKEVSVLDEDVTIAERKNMAYSGTTVAYGRGKGVVTAIGMRTELGKIARMLVGAKEEETPLKRRINEIGRWLSVIYVCICATIFVLGVLSGLSLLGIVIWCISLAVAIVPETLPLIITGTLALGMQRMARKRAIVRKLPAVETLGCITAICSDKTGTLTKNEMTVRRVYVGEKVIEVTGAGYEPKGEFFSQNKKIEPGEDESLRMAFQIAVLCNDSRLRKEGDGYKINGDPTEGALVVAAEKAGLNKVDLEERYMRVGEIPFERERKRMTTVHQDLVEGKKVAYVKGAPEVLLDLSTGIYRHDEGKAVIEEITDADRREVLNVSDKMAADALRVIAVAYRDLPEEEKEEYNAGSVEKNLIFAGLLGMTDPPREEVKDAIERCKKAGIKPIMITGDHKLTAMAIAKELGMTSFSEDEKVLTGAELEKMSEEELEEIVDNLVVYSRVSPAHKLRIVESLKRKGNVVAMTGDGINDAPALKRSDVGVAMNSGTEVAKEASDMVLTDNNFATIVAAIHEGRAIYDNMKKYLVYQLSYAFAEVCLLVGAFFFGFFFFGVPLFPLIAIQILWANLVIEDLPAMGLGIDPPDPDIMEREPRDPKERVFTKRTLHLLILMSAVIFIGCLGVFLKYLPEYGYGTGTIGDEVLRKAQTMVFATFILYEMINAFNCRSERHSVLRVGIGSNKWLIFGVIGSIILMVIAIQIPFTGAFFHTTPLTILDWSIALATSITIFVVVEVWKALNRILRKGFS